MYIGVSENGHVICNRSGKNPEDPVTFEYREKEQGMELQIASMAWRNGNVAKILLDGTDFSCNFRGLNLVVYDNENQEVLDSIGFDAHTEKFVFERKALNG